MPPKGVSKTTSGKIARSKVKQLYCEAALDAIYPRAAGRMAGAVSWLMGRDAV